MLLVEDDPTFAKLTRALLLALDDPRCDVATVASVDEALRRLRLEPFDVVVTDLGLPDSQGDATVARLREAAGPAPIVVLSGAEERPAGASFVLVKGGIATRELGDALHSVLGGLR